MSRPLLETKLFAPTWRRGLIARPRLIERLNRGFDARLTLVSAPAGFGKTTLIAAWMAACSDAQRPVAWLSLDHTDNHALSFWTYVIAALQRAAPGVGAGALALLDSGESAIDIVLAELLNELSG